MIYRVAMPSGKQEQMDLGSGAQGINTREPLTIADGQAAEGRNLWFQDGLLQGRPCLELKAPYSVSGPGGTVEIRTLQPLACSELVLLEERTDKTTGTVTRREGFYLLCQDLETKGCAIYAYDRAQTGVEMVGGVSCEGGCFVTDFRRAVEFETQTDWVRADSVLFVGGGTLLQTAQSAGKVAFEAAVPYVPTVMMNKRPDGSAMSDPSDQKLSTFLEDFNLLSGRWKELFTPDSQNSEFHISDAGLSRSAQHTVTWDCPAQDIGTLRFVIPPATAQAEYAQSQPVAYLADTSLQVRLYHDRGVFQFLLTDSAGTEPFPVPRLGLEINNIEIETEKAVPQTQAQQIGNCTLAHWYGGTAKGMQDGVSLFVSGNPDYPSHVFWSAPANPFYFPESNYNLVGANGQRVTALAGQYDSLIVFKDRSVCAMQYYYSTDLFAGEATPYLATYEINAQIGCCSAGSVQLIDNCLVWLGQDAKIYTLRSTSRTSEKNVRRLSANVDSLLRQLDSDLSVDHSPGLSMRPAASADFRGYYLLFCGQRCLAWHYEATPYQDSADTDKAQERLAWYALDFPVDIGVVQANAENLILLTQNGCCTLVDDGPGDKTDTAGTVTPFEKLWRTKQYHLDHPEQKKLVSEVFVHFSDTCTAQVAVSLLCDDGAVALDTPVWPRSREGKPGHVVRFLPRAKGCTSFGLCLRARQGTFALAGVSAVVESLGRIH